MDEKRWLADFQEGTPGKESYSTTGEAYGRSLILIPAGITPFETLIEIRFPTVYRGSLVISLADHGCRISSLIS